MVRLVAFLGIVFWLLPMGCFGQQNDNESMVIVIDPGHGGTDSGAVGTNGIQEKDVVLKIAKEIDHLNRAMFKKKYEIYLTRYSDTLISLRDRTKLARKVNIDFFISLHCNHSGNTKAKGIEVYVSNKKSGQTKESILLAYKIQHGMRQNLGFIGRGVKFADFQVLREAGNHHPTVLVEFGFLSNDDEARYLGYDENILATALSLLNALTSKKIKP